MDKKNYTTFGQPDDLLQELKEYVASYPPSGLFWKTAKAFNIVKVLRLKAYEVFGYFLFTAGDYGDFTKPVIVSYERFLAVRGYGKASNKDFYIGLKELLALGLWEYVSGKYEKQNAYEEKKKVFGEKAYKTRSYNETNAYRLTPSVAYGVVACFLMERKNIDPALLTEIALKYREKILKAFGKDYTSLSMKDLNEEIKKLQTPYLLPAYTLRYFNLDTDLELLDPFSREVRDLAERLKALFTGEPQQLTLPMDDPSKPLETQATQDWVNYTQSDWVNHTHSDWVNHTHNPHPFILQPSNLQAHTPNEKEGSASETQAQKRRPVKTSASKKPPAPRQTPDWVKDTQSDAPPNQSDTLKMRVSKKPPTQKQTPDQPDGSSPTAFEVYSRLSKELKEWIRDRLKEKGVREPLALLKTISPDELRENVEDFLKAEMDAELYELFKNKLDIYALAQLHILPPEEKETFLAQKDEKVLQEYRAWRRARTLRALKGHTNTIFMLIFKTLTKPLPKETFKEKVNGFIKETAKQKATQKELASVVKELLIRLKTLGCLTEYEENGTPMVRLSVKSYDNISRIIEEYFSFSGAPKPETPENPEPPTEEEEKREEEREDGYEDDVDVNEIPF